MATGYTEGIINGEIKTFKQFAKKCMRAFGATVHMRYEPFDEEYEPREPFSYHTDRIQEIKNEIEKVESLSNEEIAQLQTDELHSELKRHNEAFKKNRKTEKKLKQILYDVHQWEPPTEDYKEFKSFMVDQLQKTIKFESVSGWRKERVKEVEKEIISITGESERKRMLERLNEDLKYHEEEYQKEVKRCKEANEWVQKLVESL